METNYTTTEHDHLTEHEAASLLSLSVGYVRRLRVIGGGPKFRTLGAKAIRYRRGDLLAWSDGKCATSTTERDAMVSA